MIHTFLSQTICMHVTSLERGDFKLSIGSLNNKFPYMVEGSKESCYEPKLEKKTSEARQ